VKRQHDECVDLVERSGWSVVDVYEDNDVSASKGRVRPEYERLLNDLMDGRIDAVVAWHPDRLHRSTVELERFIDAVERSRAEVATVSAGTYDLTTPAGRMTARVIGATARYEVEQKVERQQAANRQRVKEGASLIGRDRLFGYTHSTSPVVVAQEAEVIRELAVRVVKGETLRSVARDLDRRSIRTTRGNPFTAARIKELLLNERLAGRARYEGELYVGAWEPILSVEQQKAVAAVLNAPERMTSGGSTARKALLPGFLYCGTCGNRMYSSTSSGVPTYSCKKQNRLDACGSMNIRRKPVDTKVRDHVLTLLSQQDADVEPSEELAEALEAVTSLENRLSKLDEDFYVNGSLEETDYRRLRSQLEQRLATAHRAASEATFGSALRDLPRDFEGLAEAYDKGTLDFRRSLIDATIERIVINPPLKAGSVGVDPADRVDITSRPREYGVRGIASKR